MKSGKKVTVAVTTFNSSLYVLETLESVYEQTYSNIELIISDDFSSDDTLELVENWIKQDRVITRFVNVEVISVPNNTGVSANCNRCIKASGSEWIKFIAGDDLLLPNCIEANMTFANENDDAKIIFSQVKMYQDTFEDKNYVKSTPIAFPDNLMNAGLTASDQFMLLLESDRIHYTPSYFFNKDALAQVGNYDENNRLVEDYPMWLKLTNAGVRLYYFHKATVGYRVHSHAINNTGDDLLFKPSAINGYKARKLYAHPYLPKGTVLQEKWVYVVTQLFHRLGISKRTRLNLNLYKGMTVYANPFVYYNSIVKRLR